MRRALCEEQVSPAAQPDTATGPEASAPEEPQGRQGKGLHATALDRCLIPVRVQILGKGVAHEAAAVMTPVKAAAKQSALFFGPGKQRATPFGPDKQSAPPFGTGKQSAPPFGPGKQSAPPFGPGKRLQPADQHSRQHAPRANVSEPQQSRTESAEGQQMSDARVSLGLDSGQKKSQDGTEQAYRHVELQTSGLEQGDESANVKRARLAEGGHVDADPRMNTNGAAALCEDADDDPNNCDSALQSAEEQQPAVSSPGNQPDLGNVAKQVVIGFVTSEAPRGLSGGAGATALCSIAVLRQLFWEQCNTGVLQNSQHGIVVAVRHNGSLGLTRAALHQSDSLPWHQVFSQARQH